ncbi:sigma 54-interacting transcriptional regulator [Solidesulfovibrio sp.]|uniref:sigma-54 interaction domain-containing protein n=1 Tax=Solidesulfovibrio sp. TaxID=2910990 RepID=UPI00260ABE97|nr:sigma 54-interacting transcriptional regulator [Solidesulfovibrio sp.]
MLDVAAAAALGRDVGELLAGRVTADDFTPGELFAKLLAQYGTDAVQGLSCAGASDVQMVHLADRPATAYYLFSNVLRLSEGSFDGLVCLLLDRDPRTGHRCRDHFHKRLLGLSPGMAYQILNDGKWTVRYVSEGCRGLTGYPQEHFRDKTFSVLSGLFHPEDETEALGAFYTSIANEKPYEHEFRIIDASGREKWVLNRGRGVFSDCQELVSVEGFMSDMSHYKRTEQRLRDERQLLRAALRDRKSFGQILGQSPAMHKVYDLIIKAAMSDDSVFVHGETGTGKELVAQAIHANSRRQGGPYVAVNCGAIPETLIEGEFFGHKKGAFTGATQDKKGYLESASGGTLFLDEIGEISLAMQVKLLRALEVGGFSPVGGSEIVRPNLRIIAASNKDLKDLVQAGLIRRDFFYRIYVIPILLPPLRERGDDIRLLADHFAASLGKSRETPPLAKAHYELLMSYSWPGNVRELQNAIRRYLTLGNFDFLRDSIDQELLASLEKADEEEGGELDLQKAVEVFEKRMIVRALDEVKWHKIKAASRLGISRRTLFRKIKELGLE